MVVRVRRVRFADASISYTVIGSDHLPVHPLEEFLAYLRISELSPNTVRAYAQGLAVWWGFLDRLGVDWTDFPSSVFGNFLQFLRTGDDPLTTRVGMPSTWLAPSSVAQRSAAVLSFYRFQAATHGINIPYQRLYSAHSRRRSPYLGELTGIADRSFVSGQGRESLSPIYRQRSPAGRRTPLLNPSQVRSILDSCARQRPDHSWEGSLTGVRDRLFFAVLAETGMRLGEALSLKHDDVHLGAGNTPFIDVVPRQDHPRGCRVKGSRWRRIFIGDDLESLYSSYVWELVDAGIDLDIDDIDQHWLFTTVKDHQWRPLRPESIYGRVRALNRKLPLLPQGWSPHWFRHTHATALLLSGVPAHVVMRRLGHADIQTTLDAYGWVTEEAEMRSVAEWKKYTAGWKGIHEKQ